MLRIIFILLLSLSSSAMQYADADAHFLDNKPGVSQLHEAMKTALTETLGALEPANNVQALSTIIGPNIILDLVIGEPTQSFTPLAAGQRLDGAEISGWLHRLYTRGHMDCVQGLLQSNARDMTESNGTCRPGRATRLWGIFMTTGIDFLKKKDRTFEIGQVLRLQYRDLLIANGVRVLESAAEEMGPWVEGPSADMELAIALSRTTIQPESDMDVAIHRSIASQPAVAPGAVEEEELQMALLLSATTPQTDRAHVSDEDLAFQMQLAEFK